MPSYKADLPKGNVAGQALGLALGAASGGKVMNRSAPKPKVNETGKTDPGMKAAYRKANEALRKRQGLKSKSKTK